MKRKGLQLPLLPLLAGSLFSLLAGLAPAAPAPGERPRPENFASYGLYVAALVDYERAQDAAAASTSDSRRDKSKVCADTQDGKSRQQNSCQGKYLAGQELIEEKSEQPKEPLSDALVRGRQEPPESLEAAVASAGYDPVSAANADALRQNTTGMTLQEISVDEMASAGVDGLLGMFNNIRMQGLNRSAAPLGTWGLAAGGSSSTASEGDSVVRLSLDDLMLALDTLNIEVLGNLVNFGNGYGIVEADVSINASGGLHIDLSSEIYTGLQIVDRDGLPGSPWAGAGAITLDRMELFVPYMSVDIQGISADFERGDNLLTIDAYSPGEIYANLANTRIGVAPATVDGSWIGPSTNVVEFGPTSRLTIAGGTRVNVALGKPDGLNRALATLNGRIGDISLNDMRVVDTIAGGSVGFGRLNMTGLELVDTRVFIEDKRITIDAGRGFTNVGMDIERVWLGSPVEGQFVGDFYVRGARLNELRLTATPH